MTLPLATAAISILNAASFLLLAPSAELGDYISCSALYSLGSWMVLWVLPAVWEYRATRLPIIRAAQLRCAAVAVALMLALHPNSVGLLLGLLLVVETAWFPAGLLLIESRTVPYQRLEFARGMSNSVGLVITVLLFRGRPAVMCAMLIAVTLLVCIVARVLGVYRSPALAWRALSLRAYRQHGATAFRSRPLRALASARACEICGLLLLNRAGYLGAVVCLKVGIAIGTALGTNARRSASTLVLACGTGLYFAVLEAVLVVRKSGWFPIPGALARVASTDVWLAFPGVFLVSSLLLRSLTAPDSVASPVVETKA